MSKRAWITIDDIDSALKAGKLWKLSKGPAPNRRMAIADSEPAARAQFPGVVDDTWECVLVAEEDVK